MKVRRNLRWPNINKEPQYRYYGTGYQCPVCHLCYGVREDDSFLRTMVSEKQVENTRRIEEVLRENEMLAPFKVVIDAPCEICGMPVNEWDVQNVKLAIHGLGCGHSACWNSELGQLRQLRKGIEKLRGKE